MLSNLDFNSQAICYCIVLVSQLQLRHCLLQLRPTHNINIPHTTYTYIYIICGLKVEIVSVGLLFPY